MKIVSQPLPCVHLVHCETRRTVRKWRKEEEAPRDHEQDNAGSDPAAELASCGHALTHRTRCSPTVALDSGGWFSVQRLDAENEFDERASDKTRCEMGWQVVVQEELTTHDVKWDVVGSPSKEEEAS